MAIIAAECGKAVSKETKVDILVTPISMPYRLADSTMFLRLRNAVKFSISMYLFL